MIAAPMSTQPSSTASGPRVAPRNDPGPLPGAAAVAVTVPPACVGVGVFLDDTFDFPGVPVSCMRAGLLAYSNRRRQAAVRQIDGVA